MCHLQDLQRDELPADGKRRLPLLERLDFIAEGRNIILAGNPGTGRTHLATGLGIKACLEVEMKKTSEFDLPEELQNKFEEDPTFKKAFYELTPGRQRGYLLHFSQAKLTCVSKSGHKTLLNLCTYERKKTRKETSQL